MNPIASRCRFLLTGLATVAATTLLAAPANAAEAPGGASCPDTPVVQPFAPWGDSADYFLAPDGGFEQGGAGWTLLGRAAVQSGNEPFALNAAGDRSSLRLPVGSSATSPLFRIGAEHRSMRFVADAATSSRSTSTSSSARARRRVARTASPPSTAPATGRRATSCRWSSTRFAAEQGSTTTSACASPRAAPATGRSTTSSSIRSAAARARGAGGRVAAMISACRQDFASCARS